MSSDPNLSPAVEFCDFDPLSDRLPADAWRRLCDEALDPNPFFGPDFLRPYLENMEGRSIRLAVVRDVRTGSWLLAAPLGKRRLGLVMKASTVWATEYSPLGVPLMHASAGTDAVDAFYRGAAGPGKLLAIPYLPLASQTAARLTGAGAARISVAAKAERSGHDAGTAGKAQLEAAFSGKRRKEMRRLLRRLGDHGEVRFQNLHGPQVPDAFEAFLALEAAGWKGRSGTALASRPQTETFSRSAIANLARSGGVRIDQLQVGDGLVASLILIQQGGRVFSWKIAFDEDYARHSPGAQIVLQAMRENLASPGFTAADSLATPGHSMIGPLWRGRVETGTLLVAGGAAGGLMLRLGMADLALERSLRRMVRAVKKRLKG